VPGHAGRHRAGPAVDGHGPARAGRAEQGDVEGVKAGGGDSELTGPEGEGRGGGLQPLVEGDGVGRTRGSS
jgi:hypothetical protein